MRRVRWGWAFGALACLVIGFVTFTNASQLTCAEGEECWFTLQDRIGQGLIAVATIVGVCWCAWQALRHDPGVDPVTEQDEDATQADPKPDASGPDGTD